MRAASRLSPTCQKGHGTQAARQHQSRDARHAHAGTQLQIPHSTTPQQLENLLNGLLTNEEKVPYAFYVENEELTGEVGAALLARNVSLEKVVDILYRPQAVFRVRPVGRCTATMSGAQTVAQMLCWSDIRRT